MLIKNLSGTAQAVPNFPAFAAGEVREVTQTDAEILLRNPHFAEADALPGAENRETAPSAKRKPDARTEARAHKTPIL